MHMLNPMTHTKRHSCTATPVRAPRIQHSIHTHVHTSAWDQRRQRVCWRARRIEWNSSVMPWFPHCCPPLPQAPSPSPWLQSSQLYFLPSHAFKERVSTPRGVLVKKAQSQKAQLKPLPDEHLVRFLFFILKWDNGLQSCLTGLLRLYRDKKRRHALNLRTAHGSALVMTTRLSSQVMAIESVFHMCRVMWTQGQDEGRHQWLGTQPG